MEENNNQSGMMTLKMEDGTEVLCEVMGILQLEDKNYIVLLPEGQDNAYIYIFEEVDGAPVLSSIENDEEYEKVSNELTKMLENYDQN